MSLHTLHLKACEHTKSNFKLPWYGLDRVSKGPHNFMVKALGHSVMWSWGVSFTESQFRHRKLMVKNKTVGNSGHKSENQAERSGRNCRKKEWKEGPRKCLGFWGSRCTLCCGHNCQVGRYPVDYIMEIGVCCEFLHKAEWHHLQWDWQSIRQNDVSTLLSTKHNVKIKGWSKLYNEVVL